ncbi:MAG: LysR family transcriptional regulator, partial [Mesorhizobium sp.]
EVRSPLYAMHRADRSPKPAAAWLIDQFKRQLGCFNEFEPGQVATAPRVPSDAQRTL